MAWAGCDLEKSQSLAVPQLGHLYKGCISVPWLETPRVKLEDGSEGAEPARSGAPEGQLLLSPQRK